MLLSGCLSWFGRNQGSRDDRFAEYAEYTSTKPVVKTELFLVERRMPAIEVVEAHWVSQQKEGGRYELPAPEPRYWFHVVAELGSDSINTLMGASTGAVDVLPGIQPDLRQYVPKDDVFVSVPSKKADEILDVAHLVKYSSEASKTLTFNVEQLVVSSNSNLMILIGLGFVY